MKESYCVITFQSTYYALQCEKVLKEREIFIKLMPVPRQVSSSCGIAGQINCQEKELIMQICDRAAVEYDGIYYINKKNKNI